MRRSNSFVLLGLVFAVLFAGVVFEPGHARSAGCEDSGPVPGDGLPQLSFIGDGKIGTMLEVRMTGIPGWSCWMAHGFRFYRHPVKVHPYYGRLGIVITNPLLPGVINPSGYASWTLAIPADPMLIGWCYHFQGLVYETNPLRGAFSDLAYVKFYL